jgi:hypothetical protein
MDLTAEIKNKEESLSALMSRVLKEPLPEEFTLID